MMLGMERCETSSGSRDLDEQALSLGILLSRQKDRYGMTMYEYPKIGDPSGQRVRALLGQGYSKEGAEKKLFEDQFGQFSDSHSSLDLTSLMEGVSLTTQTTHISTASNTERLCARPLPLTPRSEEEGGRGMGGNGGGGGGGLAHSRPPLSPDRNGQQGQQYTPQQRRQGEEEEQEEKGSGGINSGHRRHQLDLLQMITQPDGQEQGQGQGQEQGSEKERGKKERKEERKVKREKEKGEKGQGREGREEREIEKRREEEKSNAVLEEERRRNTFEVEQAVEQADLAYLQQQVRYEPHSILYVLNPLYTNICIKP
ncbi:hypothetical protein B484DRAFT_425600 [Ochromonadaceae sp. CCMP2298]|nr:hypothetical protein B484DRAFT_425600 [Ochromonadaceae sp. CCMP2298]